MKECYLVYKTSRDSDFDSRESIYILGLYKNESTAKNICEQDICKSTYYTGVKINKDEYIKL